MNTKTIITALVGIAIILGAFHLTTREKQEMAMVKDDGAMVKNDTQSTTSDPMMMKKDEMQDKAAMSAHGVYEVYAPEKLSRAETGDVVLFFKAAWCPSCRTVDADIKKNISMIPESLTILEVDYDAAAELKARYSVTYQHTFVQVDSQGAMIKKWSGSPTLSALIAEVK